MSRIFNRSAFPAPPPVRRNPRDETSIFIVVSGFDSAGHFFTEHTATTNISENGCCFRLRQDVAFEGLLAIQTIDASSDAKSHPALYQVAWMERLVKGVQIGVARLHGESSWHLAQPLQAAIGTPKA